MSPQVNSQVTKIEVKDGTPQSAVITVQLSGFETGEYAQLSGFAAQKDGGFATISGEYEIGAVNPSTGAAVFDITVTPMRKFVKGAEVTTSLSAAKIWLTILDDAQGGDWAWTAVYAAPHYGGNWGSQA